MIRVGVEQIPHAHREVDLVELVTDLNVEQRLRP